MKYFKVKFKQTVAITEKAVLLETWGNGNVWLPLKCIRERPNSKGVAYIVPEWLYIEKGLNGKLWEPCHKPDEITPEYNKQAIDELKF